MKRCFSVIFSLVLMLVVSTNTFAASNISSDKAPAHKQDKEKKVLITIPLTLIPEKTQQESQLLAAASVSCIGYLKVSSLGFRTYGDWSMNCNSPITYVNLTVAWSGNIGNGGGTTDYFRYSVIPAVSTIYNQAENFYLSSGTYTATLSGNLITFGGFGYTVVPGVAKFTL